VVHRVSGGTVINVRGLAFIVVPVVERVRVMSQHGNVTLLVRVEGLACAGMGVGEKGGMGWMYVGAWSP
jgi:hypothetical protein